jgi:NAD(P)-dependent dehydrogenase (short-subunit alcohol dehydrogenase family)
MGNSCAGLVALVTGASKGGTGTALAIRLAAEGAAVAIVARDGTGLAATAERIRGSGGTVQVLPCNLADPDGGRDALVERVQAELGGVDILVNNAASNGYRPFTEWTPKQLEIAQQVNVWAPWRLMADVAPGMRQRRRGAIVNITSFAAELPPGPPFPSNQVAHAGSGYGTTKAALNRLTASVAAEMYADGVAVNALAPQSAIATPHLLAQGGISADHFEPLETMAEATVALATADPARLTGRIAYSLQLLVELDRSVFGLDGLELLEGWQPADLPAVIARQSGMLEESGWADPFRLH